MVRANPSLREYGGINADCFTPSARNWVLSPNLRTRMALIGKLRPETFASLEPMMTTRPFSAVDCKYLEFTIRILALVELLRIST